MKATYKTIVEAIEQNKQIILDAERHIWKHPESGFKEWNTHAYLKEQYEKLGYTVTEFGNIPGFSVDIETGKPGPKIAVFGEMDAMIIPGHPESDKQSGAVHACGHNCQSAALLGVAIAMRTPAVLDELSGSIKLIAVPAEELIERDYRKQLREKGVIRYLGGKLELIYRGVLDDVDMAMMIHTGVGDNVRINAGSVGSVIKKATFIGKSAHAGGSPHNGLNAFYAATNAVNAANALRETFKNDDMVRFHPIITECGTAVNAIPDKVVVESSVRGASIDVITDVNKRVNRAFAASAATMGCRVVLEDEHGYAPRLYDKRFIDVFRKAAQLIMPEDKVVVTDNINAGCSDLGDVSTLMPTIHPRIGGAVGSGHGTDYYIKNPELAVVKSAEIQALILAVLMKNDAREAKNIVKNKQVIFSSKEEYFAAIDSITANIDAVTYNSDGTISLRYFLGV